MIIALQGSPKQIAWALKIRIELLNRWSKSDPEVFEEIEPVLNNETSAAWWITHKEKEIRAVLPYLKVGSTGNTKEYKSLSSAPKASSPDIKVYETCSHDGIFHRYIGETRDVLTGKVVDNPECPF